MKACSKCGVEKPLDSFHNEKKGKNGKAAQCKECKAEARAKWYHEGGGKEVAKRYASENPEVGRKSLEKYRSNPEVKERMREYSRQFLQDNPEYHRMNQARYRARKAELPNDLTSEQVLALHEWFGGSCAFCDNPAEHLDHFIPIVSGHGGTTIENMIPLCSEMNLSKGGKNPYVWRSTLDADAQKRFDDVVAYIAEINDLEPEGYEAHVNSCF